MSPVRLALVLVLAVAGTAAARAATPKEIDAAVQKGVAYLKKSGGAGDGGKENKDAGNVGATALAGLALLENGVSPDDAAVKKITASVRDASYTQTQTYQITLCLLYLDRHGDPGDRPLIQVLGVRLLAGQNAGGGWTYECTPPVPPATERTLRTKLSGATLTAGNAPPAPKGVAPDTPKLPAAGKLQADVEAYRRSLVTDPKKRPHDDNSNTQFGVLGVWTARKHGVPVEHALDLIEKRFLTQQGASGGWPYHGPAAGADGSPSMTCAGLLGLATAIGRREERRLKADAPAPVAKEANPAPKAVPPGVDPNDPFYNPPAPKADPAKKDAPAPKGNKPAGDARDAAIKRGMDHLGAALAGQGGKGKQSNVRDLYFFWSLERVGVIFGVDSIGATDWYDFGASVLIPAQRADGSWSGGYGADVDTAFALLFLSRSNLARDLASKVQGKGTELRANAGAGPPDAPAAKPEPAPANPFGAPDVKPTVPDAPKPAAGATAADLALQLMRAPNADWPNALKRARDGAGQGYTGALLAVIPLLDDMRKTGAREALTERLCRMTPTSLRGMLKADDAELRRAAALACAMKDDKDHIPDLIGALSDKDDAVAKAARAGLKSLTGKDFATADAWRAWYEMK
ncbi:MAG: hypothetical protein ACKODX_10310 [Gemmata sp.]